MSYFRVDIGGDMSYFVTNRYISMKINGIQARINENGRIVIPAVIRKGMGLRLGDTVVMSLEDGVLRIEPQQMRKLRVKERPGKSISPDRARSKELVSERDEEAGHGMEEWLG